MNRLEHFMTARAAETYPEPRHEGHDTVTRDMAPHVARLIPPGGRVLDVGCGQGPALEWFSNEGYRAMGISLNQQDLDVCKGAGWPVVHCDQNELFDFWTGCFDCVWARHVLEHSVAPFWTLHEFARVLTPEGILYVEVPAPDTSSRHETNPNHYSVLGLHMWRSLIERAGFEIVQARAINLTTPCGPDIYWSLICQKTATD